MTCSVCTFGKCLTHGAVDDHDGPTLTQQCLFGAANEGEMGKSAQQLTYKAISRTRVKQREEKHHMTCQVCGYSMNLTTWGDGQQGDWVMGREMM